MSPDLMDGRRILIFSDKLLDKIEDFSLSFRQIHGHSMKKFVQLDSIITE